MTAQTKDTFHNEKERHFLFDASDDMMLTCKVSPDGPGQHTCCQQDALFTRMHAVRGEKRIRIIGFEESLASVCQDSATQASRLREGRLQRKVHILAAQAKPLKLRAPGSVGPSGVDYWNSTSIARLTAEGGRGAKVRLSEPHGSVAPLLQHHMRPASCRKRILRHGAEFSLGVQVL